MEMENRKIGLIGTKDGREEKEITLNFRQVDRWNPSKEKVSHIICQFKPKGYYRKGEWVCNNNN